MQKKRIENLERLTGQNQFIESPLFSVIEARIIVEGSLYSVKSSQLLPFSIDITKLEPDNSDPKRVIVGLDLLNDLEARPITNNKPRGMVVFINRGDGNTRD